MKNFTESATAANKNSAAVSQNRTHSEKAEAHGYYTVECVGADGTIKWFDDIDNLVTTVGKNDALDKYLTGSAYTATWYLGLISITGYSAIVVGDTALSHTGWTEDINYSGTSRITPAFAVAAGSSKSTSAPASFSITGTTTIKGCFLVSNSVKSSTSGILYSAGLFSGGDKPVAAGDTLNVTYTASF